MSPKSVCEILMNLAWTVRSTPGHGSARLVPWRLSLTRLTEDQLSDPKGDLNVLSPEVRCAGSPP